MPKFTAINNINKYINFLIIFYAFTLHISKAGTTVSEISLIILWLLERDFSRKFTEIKTSNLIINLVILIIISIVAISWSSDKSYAYSYIAKYWHFLLIPIIYTSVKVRYVTPIFSAFLLGMLISEIASYGIFFELIHYKDIPPSDPSPFMDHTNYSVYLSFTSILLLNKSFFESTLKNKSFFFLCFIITTSSLFINGGRTGQVIFIASLFLLGLLNIQHKIKAMFIMLILASAILVTAYSTSSVFHSRFNQLNTDITNILNNNFTGSFGQRVSLWNMGSHIAIDNLPFGTGLGDEMDGMTYYAKKFNYTHYMHEEAKGYIDYHNAFVQYTAQLGIFGIILFINLFYILSRNRFIDKINQNLNSIFILSFALLSMVGPSLHLMSSMVFFSLFSALLSKISIIDNPI